MIDKETSEIILGTMLEKRANKVCVDCDNTPVECASVNNGCFICSDCAAIHSTLGDSVSKLQSLTETWTLPQLRVMSSGGNSALKEFMSHFAFPDNSIPHVYRTVALSYYRMYLKAVANGKPLLCPRPTPEEGVLVGHVQRKKKVSLLKKVVSSSKDIGQKISEIKESKSFQSAQHSTSAFIDRMKQGISKATDKTLEWAGSRSVRRFKERTVEAYGFMAKKTKDAFEGVKGYTKSFDDQRR